MIEPCARWRPARRSDVEVVGETLRPEDVREVRSSHDCTGIEAVFSGFMTSDLPVTLLSPDGVPIAMCGCQGSPEPGAERVCVAWLLGTTLIARYPVWFVRSTVELFPRLVVDYDVAYNAVDTRHTQTALWLDFLGFQPSGQVLAQDGTPFDVMVWRRSWAEG